MLQGLKIYLSLKNYFFITFNQIDVKKSNQFTFNLRDMWREDTWYIQQLYTQLPPEVVALFTDSRPCLVQDMHDTWMWKCHSSGKYSVRSAYNWLLQGVTNVDSDASWTWLWKLSLPANIQFFLWQVCDSYDCSNSFFPPCQGYLCYAGLPCVFC